MKEKIDINERVFAVKVQSGEESFIWVIAWKYPKLSLDEETDFLLVAADENFDKALIKALNRFENNLNFFEKKCDEIVKIMGGSNYLSDEFSIEHGFNEYKEITYCPEEDKYYLLLS